tara:strand:- start:196 stop:603 length:408 start_codon:yes stop_codon:yes gene_type:complete
MSKAAELAEFGGGISSGPNAVEGLCKAYAHYDQVTTSLTVRKTFNCSSITDDGTGQATTNYTSNLSDTYYVAGGHAGRDTSTSVTAYWIFPTSDTTIAYSTSATSWKGGFNGGSSSALTANNMFMNLMTLHGDLA